MENTNTEEDVEAEIHTACKNGDWQKFQVLINNGADLKLLGEFDKTCLHFASQGNFFINSILFSNYFYCSYLFGSKKYNMQKTTHFDL